MSRLTRVPHEQRYARQCEKPREVVLVLRPAIQQADVTAERNYIKEFVMARSRELGKQYGVEYAEAFHYVAPVAAGADRDPKVDAYVKEHAVPVK